MNTRRSFLRLLGIGAVAAPTVAMAAPAPTVSIEMQPLSPRITRNLLAAQDEINRRRRKMLAIIERSNNCRPLFGPGDLMFDGVIVRGDSDYDAFADLSDECECRG